MVRRPIVEHRLYENDELMNFSFGVDWRRFKSHLRRAGFVCSPGREAYYHPKHWRVAVKGIGDTWFFNEGFYALTPEARNWMNEEE